MGPKLCTTRSGTRGRSSARRRPGTRVRSSHEKLLDSRPKCRSTRSWDTTDALREELLGLVAGARHEEILEL
eukprot:13126546-Alexandrium_andersonii.AAC.1